MSAREAHSPSATRRESKSRAALVAAYREGLGLAAVAVIRGPAGIRVAPDANGRPQSLAADEEVIAARWWCRRAEEAERVAAAATARLRRRESRDAASGVSTVAAFHAENDIFAAVEHAAKRLRIVLYADEEISREAERIIARVEDEIERLRQAGELKTVNRSYRAYRMEASAHGEKTLPYAEWFNKYKANLVRQLAAALWYS